MDTAILVNQRFDQGYSLVKRLADGGFDISCACWLLGADEERWLMFIVSEVVDIRGGLAAYREVNARLEELQGTSFGISDIKVLANKNTMAKTLLVIVDGWRSDTPQMIDDSRLRDVNAKAGYFYPSLEKGFPGFVEIKRHFPSAELLIVPVPTQGQRGDWFFQQAATLIDKVNSSEFQGKEPGTVMCVGPRLLKSGASGQVVFVHRPEGWNKVYRADKKNWEEVYHIQTGKRLYDEADFGIILDMK